MKLEELLKKYEKLNKLNEEIGIENKKYYLVIQVDKYSKLFNIWNKKDIETFKNYYLESISSNILNNKLEKINQTWYTVDYINHIGEKEKANVYVDLG